jgi:hypothetical protein
MKHLRWRWILPVVQLIVAVAGHVYGPHEYRLQATRDHAVDNRDYLYQHEPARSERISRGINFPALALAYLWRNKGHAIYEDNGPYTSIWIAPSDVMFFAGVLLFWFWAGSALDRRTFDRHWPSRARVAWHITGIAFGALNGAYAIQMTAAEWAPERHIGVFGLVWAVLLTAYFAGHLLLHWRVQRRDRWAKPSRVRGGDDSP